MAEFGQGRRFQASAHLCGWFLGRAICSTCAEDLAEIIFRFPRRLPGNTWFALLANALGGEYHGGRDKTTTGILMTPLGRVYAPHKALITDPFVSPTTYKVAPWLSSSRASIAMSAIGT